MKEKLHKFLQDVVAGKHGETTLTKLHIDNFMFSATHDDLHQLEDFYWDWTSRLTEEDEKDMDDLKLLIVQ